MIENGGEKCDLLKDEDILSITSPKDYLGGPYVIVFKHEVDRFTIVAIEWDGLPRLGIRWFWDAQGHPTSNHHPVWFVLPDRLNAAILNDLPINEYYRRDIMAFLDNKISGEDLKKLKQ